MPFVIPVKDFVFKTTSVLGYSFLPFMLVLTEGSRDITS